MGRREGARNWAVGESMTMTGHSVRAVTAFAGGLWAAVIAAALLIGAAAPAVSQDRTLEVLLERLDRMEATVRDVQRELFRSTPGVRVRPAPGAAAPAALTTAAGVELRIGELEAAIAPITGAMEEAGHRIDLMETRLEKLVADVDFRLTEIENSIATLVGDLQTLVEAQQAATQAPQRQAQQPVPRTETAARTDAPVEEVAPVPILPEGSAQEQYAYARSLLTRLDYEKAEEAFLEFLALNGEHELAGNAQYWLGETYYVRRKFAEAATAFVDGFQQFPAGIKAPDNLLKLGMSLAQLGQKEDACATLRELLIRFTDAEERIMRRAELEQVRIGC
jgi:tol-pal system protein YbgF